MELILKENKEGVWSRIDKKLSGVLESQTQSSIYRVHNRYLNGTNDKAFEPAIVAIGPYHRGSEGLQMMEEHKVRCLKSLHLRNNQIVERCISAAAEMEVEARGCYAEAISLSAEEFIEMLVLDGCFILHLLKMNSYLGSTTDVVVDPIFKMVWAVECLKRDLILFENQIPFFVLCNLFDLIEAPNQHENLLEMFSLFYGEITYSRWNNRSPHEVKHLLHLTHIILRSRTPASDRLNACPLERYSRLIPTATELKDANVKFRACESEEPMFHFEEGQLIMSPLSIVDGTEILLSNLIVYEQYFPDNEPAFMTDYAVVFDCLVNTRRDVEILSECGIIHSMMDDNQQAADIINRLTHSVPLSPNFFTYGNTFQSINAHYTYRWNQINIRWNKARAVLRRDYFNSPWAYISFAAAVLLLLLTLAQTVFSALQL